jgi:type III secretion protein T
MTTFLAIGVHPSPTADYLSFFDSIPELTPMALLTIFFLGFLRLIPIMVIAPFFGAKLPAIAKIGLTIAFTVILLPHIVATSSLHLTFDIHYIGYSLKELLIGMVFAMLSSIPFYIVQSSGVLIDFQRGSSAMQATDPVLQSQVSPIGILYNYLLIVIFFEIGGPFFFLDTLMQSFSYIPVDGFFSSGFFNQNVPFWKIIMELLTKFTLLSIQFAAPALVAILMADLFLGIANRLAPQVQIAFLGMAIKSLLGLILLWAGWFFVLQQITTQTELFFRQLMDLLPSFRM